ncbi:MAG: GFA family protein [Gaiellales bacterium]
MSEPPVDASYCHCTRCQHRTGGAWSLSARLAPGSLRITAGEGDISAWAPAGGFEKHFCSRCGSALFAQSPTDRSVVAVRFAAFDVAPDVKPSFRQFVASAPAWDTIPDDGIPRYDEARPPGAP